MKKFVDDIEFGGVFITLEDRNTIQSDWNGEMSLKTLINFA